MAEALAAIGLASALMQFIDFGSKVLRQLRRIEQDAENNPVIFRNVRTRLPLMLDFVKKLGYQMDAGLVPAESQAAMFPVIGRCVSQAQQLELLIDKALPRPTDSTWSKGKKAVIGVLAESDVQRINSALESDFDLLAQTGTFLSASRRDNEKPTPAPSTFNFTWVQQQPQQLEKDLTNPELSNIKRVDSAPAGKVFMVPFQRDANFLGRLALLDEVESRLETSDCVALSGLGGIGKSQIAIEYCFVFREKYPEANVFWVYGANPTYFERGYQEIARRLNLPGWDEEKVDSLELVSSWFNDESNSQWLLVIDNADDASMFFGTKKRPHETPDKPKPSFARYLPQISNGQTVITTRDKRLGERLSRRREPIMVSSMTATDSKELLRSKISSENWDEDDAMALVEELSYLPLAITQAAAFISENSLTVSEYLETMRQDTEEFKELLSEDLEDPRRDLDTENSVIRTWKLSFDQISNEAPRAADMLSTLAVLDQSGAPTPRDLLRNRGEKEIPFVKALGTLQAFSLITVSRGKDAMCKMHRLVALSTIKWIELRGTLGIWNSRVLEMMAERFPGTHQHDSMEHSAIEAIIPHADSILAQSFTAEKDRLNVAKLLVAVGLHKLYTGRYQESYSHSQNALTIRRQFLPADDPLTLETVQLLGECLLHVRKHTAARKALEEVIEGRSKVLGPKHIDTLDSLSDLAITLLDLDDANAAEEVAKRALDGREETLGNHDPETLVSLNIMGIVLHRQGNLAGAKRLYQQALHSRRGSLGQDHPHTLMTLHNLARLHYEEGDLQAAKDIYQDIIPLEEIKLGAEEYDIQLSLTNLAFIQQAEGDLKEAENTFRKVLRIREKKLGRGDDVTLLTVEHLRDLLEVKGDHTEAARLQNRLKESEASRTVTRHGKEGPGWIGALLRAGILYD